MAIFENIGVVPTVEIDAKKDALPRTPLAPDNRGLLGLCEIRDGSGCQLANLRRKLLSNREDCGSTVSSAEFLSDFSQSKPRAFWPARIKGVDNHCLLDQYPAKDELWSRIALLRRCGFPATDFILS